MRSKSYKANLKDVIFSAELFPPQKPSLRLLQKIQMVLFFWDFVAGVAVNPGSTMVINLRIQKKSSRSLLGLIRAASEAVKWRQRVWGRRLRGAGAGGRRGGAD